MKLQEEDWSGPTIRVVEFDYPDELIADFMNWLRRTPTWKDRPELMERRLKVLNERLAEYKNAYQVAADTKARNAARTEAARKALAEKRAQESLAGVGAPSLADLPAVDE